jgi:hypothetical protein
MQFVTYDGSAWGSRITLTNTGSVGIGTTSPASLLHLSKATGGTGSDPLEINIDTTFSGAWTANTDWGHINFRVPNEGSTPDGDTHIQIAANTGSSTAGALNDLVFRVKEASGGTLTERLRIDYDGTISFADKDAGETMRIDASGNVGVGTTSPDYAGFAETVLTIASTTSNTQATLEIVGNQASSNTFVSGISFHNESSTATEKRIGQIWTERADSDNDAGNLAFATATTGGVLTEAMRIDSSGNLLVGTTSTNPYTSTTETGAVVRGDEGILGASRSAGASLRVNRVGTGGTENGDIAEFRSNGTTVGSIGTTSNRLTIGSGDTGLRFVGDADQITPWNISTNAASDNLLDLGNTNNRFKDLYLSGGVVFGATGGAVTSKTLDDYEEGTWTPAYTAVSGAASYGTQQGSYTKIGNKVMVTGVLQAQRGTLSGTTVISGLPFAVNGNGGGVLINSTLNFATDMPNLKGYTSGNQINFRTQATNGGAGGSSPLVPTNLSDVATTHNYIYFTAHYFTAA